MMKNLRNRTSKNKEKMKDNYKADGNKPLKVHLSLKSPKLKNRRRVHRMKVLVIKEIQMMRLKLQSSGQSVNGQVKNNMINEYLLL